jgi:uncharacterized protein (TIGR00266 family)
MKTEINGGPSFAHIHVELQPSELIVTESDAMASMSAELDMKAKFNGGLLGGLLRKFLGGESLFVNYFKNNTNKPLHLTLVQPVPGDIREVQLNGLDVLNIQPGGYIASEPTVKLGLKYAGIRSFIAREGLFKLQLSGKGKVWYGSYGGLIDKELDGEYIVDTSHLVSYTEGIKLNIQLSGGIFSSFFSGEGLVTKLSGKGKYTIQTRSLDGLKSWMNPKI